ncbi:MAG TPA: PDZ domain-containing protein [Gemmatimonadales bacterium]|nr:PDZ domain-containing protein [Gemmatimonadales bacterium]
MWRSIVVLGALAALAAPGRAQVDTSRAGETYSIRTGGEGWLGIGLSCSRCSMTVAGRGDTHRWTFSEPPSVFSVDDNGPGDRAGLRIGDTLLAVDGVPLTTAEGGSRFGSIRPGQSIRLTFRRNGRDRTVELVAGARSQSREMSELTRALRRAQEAQEHALETSRAQLERSQETLERMRNELEGRLEEAQSQRDSASLEQLARLRRVLEDQQRVLARSLAERSVLEGREWAEPTPPPAMPAPPATPAQPAVPAPPVAAQPPMPAEAPMPPSPPISYREHRGFGPLRYTGRLGDVVIEARGPGSVTATEVSDSEVVVTSGDLSVRLALRPVATPSPAPRARPPRD